MNPHRKTTLLRGVPACRPLRTANHNHGQGDITMEIEERTAGSTVVVALTGRLDGVSAPDLEARVSGIVERGHVRMALDCGGMRFVSSTGLRALLLCVRKCRQQGGALTVAGLRPDCRTVIEVSGLLPIIDCHDTVEAALAAVSGVTPVGRDVTMEFEEETVGSGVVVSLIGRLDGVSAPEMEARIAINAMRGDVRVVLDCSRMSYISSAGLRAFLVTARNCQQQGGKLIIAALQPECRSIMNMSGFLSIIEYHETREAALAALA